MAKNRNLEGSHARTRGDVLPPDFDAETISNFFTSGSDAIAEHFPDMPGRSDDALTNARARAQADVAAKAQPVNADWLNDRMSGADDGQAEETTETSPDETESLDYAYAKPAHAGGGSKESDGTKGKGRSKVKDQNDDTTPTDTTDPTDTAGTTEPTDPTGTTDPTPPTDNTDPTDTTDSGSSGGGETNTGSNDPNVYVSGLDTPDGFNIEIAFEGSWTEAFKQVVKDTAEYFSDIITTDIASHNGIDDFHLRAIMNNIDGSGGHLGIGGTLSERPGSYLPSEGFLRVDESDAGRLYDQGNYQDVVLHEMLHSLGFGTIWNELGLVETINGEQRFTGDNAIEAYNDVFGDIAANDPYSDFGVKVSADAAHWDHGTFTHEVMTTSVYSSGNYLSDMTIGALEDMGYETTYEPGANLLA